MKKLDPILSQFDTQQQADDYHAWLSDKVEKGLSSETWHEQEDVLARAARRRAELMANLKNAG
ncbi:hypothetical protein EGK75_00540 [Neisseria weixii]|uniref:Stability determinant n=1 Tax=Neisseria weixii TaxID=1853276 RepID=A0A3N4N3L8_9NEIS|nr:hypothetical protein [Neisseria weixii]RPD90874.1 hypothetical protein EGK74_00535 [Neisseria weixii]RPD91068.1 hypothetical protein EGK75_00540 [Neisseria weixii]